MGNIGEKLAVLSALWGTVRRTDVELSSASTDLYILQFEQDANDIRARLVAAKGTDVSNPILTDPYQLILTCILSPPNLQGKIDITEFEVGENMYKVLSQMMGVYASQIWYKTPVESALCLHFAI